MDIKHKYISILSLLRKEYGLKEKSTNELDEIMGQLMKKGYIGTLASDLYPLNKKGKSYCIMNTDGHKKSGTHWLAIYRDKNKVYVYDSFARNINRLIPDFCNRMLSNGFELIQVNKKLDQGNNQEDCGLRSAVWLLCVAHDGINKACDI
jgi:hypothetical protein